MTPERRAEVMATGVGAGVLVACAVLVLRWWRRVVVRQHRRLFADDDADTLRAALRWRGVPENRLGGH